MITLLIVATILLMSVIAPCLWLVLKYHFLQKKYHQQNT